MPEGIGLQDVRFNNNNIIGSKKVIIATHHGTKSVAFIDNKMSLDRENPHAWNYQQCNG